MDTRLYSSKHIPQILIKSYITTYCSDVVRSLVPNIPEDLFDYMGTQVQTKQNEENGCFTSSTGVIIWEKYLLKVVSLGHGGGYFSKPSTYMGTHFKCDWPPWQMCNNSTGMFMSIKIIKKKNFHRYICPTIYHPHLKHSFSIYHSHICIRHPHAMILYWSFTGIFRSNITRFSFLSKPYNIHYLYYIIHSYITRHNAYFKASNSRSVQHSAMLCWWWMHLPPTV